MSEGIKGLGERGDVKFEFIETLNLMKLLAPNDTAIGRTLRSDQWKIDDKTSYSRDLPKRITKQTAKTNSASHRILNAGLLPK